MTSATLGAPRPNFSHVLHMTDARGTFEHALFTEPRSEHGYCTDDMARMLGVTAREPRPTPAVQALMWQSLRFLDDAIGLDGQCRNRLNRLGEWEDHPTLDDCWGRALWGLGTAVARSEDVQLRQQAIDIFTRASVQRSRWPRATAFAALGAAELLDSEPGHAGARHLLVDAADTMGGLGLNTSTSADWPWPEPRLTYANAAAPEAMIATGTVLRRPELVSRGLTLLGWLLGRETVSDHLSVTPAGGAGPTDLPPRFDQQPIEVAAMADACARAAKVDDDPRWLDGVRAAVAWFCGDNDCGVVMWDRATHGGYDGLEAGRANKNQGTESTLALLSTLQLAQSFELVAR
jgi:hypothetical protein